MFKSSDELTRFKKWLATRQIGNSDVARLARMVGRREVRFDGSDDPETRAMIFGANLEWRASVAKTRKTAGTNRPVGRRRAAPVQRQVPNCPHCRKPGGRLKVNGATRMASGMFHESCYLESRGRSVRIATGNGVRIGPAVGPGLRTTAR